MFCVILTLAVAVFIFHGMLYNYVNTWSVELLAGGVHAMNQRREDMTSRRSDNLHTLITFQGQESQTQVTRMALWTKSRWALSVFNSAKPSAVKIVIMVHLAG